ncbi:hypothetical protein ACET85_06650 [Aeromonas veronii]|nr:hypothetical protein [Aeromonas veronii]MBA2076592.1 hypothetical protein [Aeromonas veronii]MXV30992.1 hypothetical protein [Aeromonas veronii]
MNVREQLESIKPEKDRYTPTIPCGIEWRKQRRYNLMGGGYTALCSRTNLFMDFFNPVPYVVIRHIGLEGIGVLSHKKLKVGADYNIALPSYGSIIGQVVYSLPNNLLPKLYRSGIRWHHLPSSTQLIQWKPYILSQDTMDFERDYQLVIGMELNN